jgi:dihydrofolate reductase
MSWAEKYLSSGEDYGYFQLVSTSAAIIIGRATFDFEIESGVQGPRPLPTYVLTHIPELYESVLQENIYFTGGDIERVVELIEDKHPGKIFIMGGANVVNQLLQAKLIDKMHLFVCPEELGSGTPAFEDALIYQDFDLVEEKEYSSGIIEEVYKLSP